MDLTNLLESGAARKVVSVSPTTSLRETAQILLRHKIGAALVLDDADHLLGIVSERDLVPVIANYTDGLADAPVSTIMTHEVITCEPTDEVAFVLQLMRTKGIRHMPVVQNGKLLSMLSIRALTTAYEHLQVVANTDPLTAVSNRRPFLKTLRQEFEAAIAMEEPFSLAMLDIDHFKKVNDTYGHDVGDRVLKDISALLIDQFRSIDLVGRLGGEEFALVFPKTPRSGAKVACERLMNSIRDTRFDVQDEAVKITVSMGLATRTPEIPSDTALLKRADVALYQAKRTGRDRLMTDQC